MALDLSGLTAWVDENKMDLIKEAVLKGRTVDLINVQGGIKNAATINKLATTLNAQQGACGWNATGSTELTQRTITVCDVKINESICLNDLEDYYTSTMMNPGSYNEDIPFEQIFAENKRDQIMALVEDMIWRGDTNGSGNLALCNGFLNLLEGLTASVGSYDTVASTGLTAGNAISVVDDMVNSVPSDVIDDENLMLFMSYADYRTYSAALRDANLFHYTGAENQGQEFSQMVPGTNVRVIAVRGLNTDNSLVLSPAWNMYVGTDLLTDAEDFRIFYSQDNDEVRFLAKWKIGVQVAYPEYIVYRESV